MTEISMQGDVRLSPMQRATTAWRKKIAALVAASAAVFTLFAATAAEPAAANTPSDYSHTFYVSGLPVTVGWTNNHAWIISSYAATITAGSGLIASQLCAVVAGEGGLGTVCSHVAEYAASQLVKGHPALTNHGIWLAYYVWGGSGLQDGLW